MRSRVSATRHLLGRARDRAARATLLRIYSLVGRHTIEAIRFKNNQVLQSLIREGTVTIGPFSYGTPRVVTYPGDKGHVSIGSYCSIADDVEILVGGNHRSEFITTYPVPEVFGLQGAFQEAPATKGAVTIGHDVWIGRGALILSGVHIGDGAVVGARAVVTRHVRPYAIVVGCPAREIKRRFDDEQIRQLQAIQWWNWPPTTVRELGHLLSSNKFPQFLEAARRVAEERHDSSAARIVPND